MNERKREGMRMNENNIYIKQMGTSVHVFLHYITINKFTIYFYLETGHERAGNLSTVENFNFIEKMKKLDHQCISECHAQPYFDRERHPQDLHFG